MRRALIVVLYAVLANAFTSSPEENLGIDDANLVEGDIIVTPEQRGTWFGGRAAVTRNLWPGGLVPYEIDVTLSQSTPTRMIEEALKEWQDKTCIRFVKRTTEKAYLWFRKGQGCNSYVGTINNKQTVNIGSGCLQHGIILHEIGHALGFHHEQNRLDRDDYVIILWDNIQDRYKFAFNHKSHLNSLGTPYDYKSIMHYGAYAFSKNGKKTIQVKQSAYIGQRSRLSEIDAYQMNRLYKCPGVTEMPFTTIPPPQSVFQCTFDTGSCGFIQTTDDDFDWYRNKGATSSGGTGPNGDHTSGSGHYMYIEASRGGNSIAKMKKKIKLNGSSCLTFYYHMFGSRVGTLSVVVGGKKVFENTGDKGMKWYRAVVRLQGTGETQLEFHGTVTGHFQGDIAVDDVSMNDCTPTTSPAQVTTSPVTPAPKAFDCTFEFGSCGFTQATDDTFDWTRLNKGTPSQGTGPVGDHTSGSGYFLYTEGSDLNKGYIAKIRKTINLTGSSCLTFFYHMLGSGIGSLRVLTHGQTIFERTGNQGPNWKKTELTLQGTGETQLEFHGIVTGHYQSDIAIDDVSMKECQSPTVTQPPSRPTTNSPVFSCTFDVDLCGFKQDTGDKFDWTRTNQKTPTWDSGPDIDHTTGKGFFLYTEASNAKPSDVAILSRTISLSGRTCLKFYYHMHGQQMGTLRVVVGGQKVFERTGSQGNTWQEAVVRLKGKGDKKLEFHGVIGSSYRSDAGIDDVTVADCE